MTSIASFWLISGSENLFTVICETQLVLIATAERSRADDFGVFKPLDTTRMHHNSLEQSKNSCSAQPLV